MRLWSLLPSLLDKAGLGAVWREGLLARKVLIGMTRGYKNHPQLQRFKATGGPITAIDAYLHGICDEAVRRGYNYDRSKLGERYIDESITVNSEQMRFEFEHLQRKLEIRATPHGNVELRPHPLFVVVPGPIESWERI
jgi:hypothetical protein